MVLTIFQLIMENQVKKRSLRFLHRKFKHTVIPLNLKLLVLNFLKDACEVIKKLIAVNPDEVRFNLIGLAPKEL
jgi:hypothetical protein